MKTRNHVQPVVAIEVASSLDNAFRGYETNTYIVGVLLKQSLPSGLLCSAQVVSDLRQAVLCCLVVSTGI